MKIRVPSAPRRGVAVLAVSLAALPPVHAQTAAPALLPETVVTATRTPTRIDEQLADMTVLTRQDIERSGVSSLMEILATVPGVLATPDSLRGGNASVFIRGANHSHTLVLVDGQRVSSATTGATALQHLPLEQIERIEVLRGPASSLYGSDAIGGVIQVFTRRGSGAPTASGSVSVGSYRTGVASAGYGGQVGDTRFHVQAGVDGTRGFSDIRAPKDGGLYDSFNPDRDGYHQRNLGLTASHKASPALEVGGSFLLSDASKRSDGLNCDGTASDCTANFDNRDAQRLQSLSVYGAYQVTPAWTSTLRLGTSADRLRSWLYDPSVPSVTVERYATRQDQASWQNDVKLGQGLLMAAVEWRGLHADTTKNLVVNDQETQAASVGYQAWYGRHLVQASVRHDRVQRLGSADTGTLGYGYKLAQGWVARASAGTGFHAPSFNDLYWPLDPANFYEGNPNLRPERSKNVEAGLAYEADGISGSATVYRNSVRDLIEYYSDPVTWMGTMRNVSQATLQGASLQGRIRWSQWTAGASFDFLSARNDATGRMLARRVPRVATLDVTRRIGRLDLGARWQVFDRRYNDANNTQQIAGYGLLALRANYAIDRQWTLGASLQNAFNKDYVTARSTMAPYNEYGTAGRSLLVTLKYSGM